MKYRQDNDAMVLGEKVNAVGETMGDDTANFPVYEGKLEGMFRGQ